MSQAASPPAIAMQQGAPRPQSSTAIERRPGMAVGVGDFGEAGKGTRYMIVTGSADMPRGRNNFQYAKSILYVAEATTGQVAAYTIPWNSTLQAAGKPQVDVIQFLDSAQFRTTFVRDQQ